MRRDAARNAGQQPAANARFAISSSRREKRAAAPDLVEAYDGGPGQAGASKQGEHLFCKHCGVRSFERGHVKEVGGDYVSVKLNCLDDVDPAELAGAPVAYYNGRDNKWWDAPAETRHL